MITFELSIVWVVFFGALFGGVLGTVFAISLVYFLIRHQIIKVEREYKSMLIEGILGAIASFFAKNTDNEKK